MVTLLITIDKTHQEEDNSHYKEYVDKTAQSIGWNES